MKLRFIFLFFIIGYLLFPQSSGALLSFRQGQERFIHQDYYGAIEAYREAVNSNPHYLEALIELSRSYFMIEEYQEAQNYIEDAQAYGLNNLDLLNMEGRILIGKNELEQAQDLFEQVIRREPNNLDANLGRAEVLLLKGQHQEGAVAYRRSLILSPESKRALISMMLLFDSRQEYDKGEIYLELALKYHSDDPQVYLQAALHYLKSGNLEKALFFGENAVLINPDLPGPDYILAMIYLEQMDLDSAVAALQRELRRDSKNTQALYLMTRCLIEKGEPVQAMNLLRRMLRMDSNDEISRILLESLIREMGDSVPEERQEALDYHFSRGQLLEQEFNLSGARLEYRRCRWLEPYHYESWLAYSELLKKQGFSEASLDSLRAISESGYDVSSFIDTLRILEHSRQDTLADTWNVDQFTQQNNPYEITLFYRSNKRMYHYASEENLAEYLDYFLQSREDINTSFALQQITSYSQAYSRARNLESDYFIILDFSEQERSFLVGATLYLTRTGREIKQFSLLRMGNQRVQTALAGLAEEISAYLLPKGLLVELRGDRALLNMGTLQGVEKGQVYQVIKKDSINLLAEEPWIDFNNDDLLGTIEIESLDEHLAEGIWFNHGPFLLAAPGDEAFLLTRDENWAAPPRSNWTIDHDLKSQLLMFR